MLHPYRFGYTVFGIHGLSASVSEGGAHHSLPNVHTRSIPEQGAISNRGVNALCSRPLSRRFLKGSERSSGDADHCPIFEITELGGFKLVA
jgi:hypothetical protein